MKQKGLTLIEIIIGVLILGMISLFIGMFIISTFETYESTLQGSESFSNINVIMDKLARDIRQGRSVQNISPYSLTIQLSNGNVYTYSLIVGSDGKKYFAVNGQILAGPIQDLTFTGFDANMSYTSNPQNIRMVAYTLTTLDGRRLASSIGLRAEVVYYKTGVVITEVMYSPPVYNQSGLGGFDQRDLEFIVIYNGNPYTINIKDWKINNTTKIQTAVIPAGDFNLPPGKYAVIGGSNSSLNTFYNFPGDYHYYKTQQRGLEKANSDLPDTGGIVSIQDNIGNVIDTLKYHSSMGGSPIGSNYYSLVRKNLTSPSTDPSNWKSSSCINYGNSRGFVYCLKPVVVINEIMYRPGGVLLEDRIYEFVEIYNTSGKNLDLSGWRINGYVFSQANVWNLSPGGYAIIGVNDSNLLNWYIVPKSVVYVKTNSTGLGTRSIDLNNSKDVVEIRNNNGVILDRIEYSSDWGGLGYDDLFISYRYSLERKSFLDLSQDQENWKESNKFNVQRKVFLFPWLYNYYCTPGTPNSVSP